MPNYLSLCIEFVAVVVITRFLTDLVLVRRGAFLFDENAPDTRGVADKKHSAVIQKKSDTGNIEALDFILEVSRIFDTNDIIAVTLTPPTIEIVGFLGGAARFITKPCLKQRVMRFPTVRYGCSV